MSTNSGSIRNFISMQNKYDRVILLVDMDCFYCQVEEKLNPELKGKPLAVVQYNAWRGGGIIAVNYAARAKGVTRHIRGDEAKKQCPEIELIKVPNVREKADLSKYREAGKDVANVLQQFTPLLERASVDEAYLDITDSVNKRLQHMNTGGFVLQPDVLVNTYAVGYNHVGEYVNIITKRLMTPYADDEAFQRLFDENDIPSVRKSDISLLIGASIASEIRAKVKEVTGYECSAGIAHNKILAKLACGINKPNKQTILPLTQIPGLFDTLPISKIKGLGGKFGEDVCERMGVRFMGQLFNFTEAELQRKSDEKNGTWLYNICRGIDLEAVVPRFYSKSIGCCKKFPGRNNITGLNTLRHWVNELATEINERLEKDIVENNRKAKQIVVSYMQEFDGEEISSSRSAPLPGYDQETLAKHALDIIKANTKQFFRNGSEMVLNNPIKFLGISVGKFETITNTQNKIQQMFANQATKKRRSTEEEVDTIQDAGHSQANKVVKKLNKAMETQNGDAKMKSFFENFLQKGKSVRINETINETNNDNRESPSQERDVNEKGGAENLRRKIENNTCERETSTNSFFARALRKKNITKETISIQNSLCNLQQPLLTTNKVHENNTTSEQRNQIAKELVIDIEDDILKLEEELKLIEDEYNENTVINGEKNPTIHTPKNFFANHLFRNEQDQKGGSGNDLSSDTSPLASISPEATSSTCISLSPPHKKPKPAQHTNIIDYQRDYVEFAIPEIYPEIFEYIKCKACGTKILNEERSIQTHQDHHLAQQLSQKQRTKYRAEVKSKITSSALTSLSSSTAMNQKTKSNLNNKLKHVEITKFLKPISAQPTVYHPTVETANSIHQQTTVLDGGVDSEVCAECKIPVKKIEIKEHKDYHVAKNLQKQLNLLEVRTVTIKKVQNTRKSLNSSFNNSTQRNVTSNKSITQFFSQPNL